MNGLFKTGDCRFLLCPGLFEFSFFQFEICQSALMRQSGIIFHEFRNRVPLMNGLIFDNQQFLDHTRSKRSDPDGSWSWFNPTGSFK